MINERVFKIIIFPKNLLLLFHLKSLYYNYP